MLKDRGIFVSSVLSCFHLFPVEKRWLHTFGTRYICIAVLFFSTLIMLKDRGIFMSSVLSCFHLFPVEKRDKIP